MAGLRQRYLDIERWSPPLIRTSVVCLMLFVLALAAAAFDHRVITGAPAWLKPSKFGISTAVFLFTLAWLVRDLPRTRALRIASNLIAWLLVLEVMLIILQAVRGTSSHFNINTPLDTTIFSSMGIGIAVVWVMSMVILWQHVRTPSTDRTMAVALRIGLALNILGAGVGWKMTQPRPEQLAAMQRGERPFVAGAHTVGGRDGGLGVPITRWSRDHGDLRIPHFFGMHALQALPLFVLGLRRIRSRRDDNMERAAVVMASAAWAAVFIAALLQALHGRPLFPPSTS
jgi:hypothetical protein